MKTIHLCTSIMDGTIGTCRALCAVELKEYNVVHNQELLEAAKRGGKVACHACLVIAALAK